MTSQAAYFIRDYADLTLAKSQARLLPMLTEISEQDQTVLMTVLSELGTNIVKYAHRGYLGVRRIEQGANVDIEVFAEDEGPGIPNIDLALKEHFSTGGTLGLGLPAVQRMTDDLRIESTPGQGLKVSALKRVRGQPVSRHREQFGYSPGMVTLTHEFCDVGESVRTMSHQMDCGDVAFCRPLGDGVLLAIADATGHGAKAAQAADEIRRTLSSVQDPSRLISCFSYLHQNLRHTVGAAVGLLHVDHATQQARYVGVGNTSLLRVRGESWRPISREGVVGQRLPTLFEQVCTLRQNDVILMWTDGLSERDVLSHVRHIADKPASAIAQDLVSRAGKPYDDAGVLVLKWLKG